MFDSDKVTVDKALPVTTKLAGEIFGFEEVLNNAPRPFTCECVTVCGEVFSVSAKEFKKRMNHPDTLNVLHHRQQLSQQWSSEHFKTIQAVERSKLKQQLRATASKPVLETPRKSVKRLWTASMATTQTLFSPRPPLSTTTRKSDCFFATEVPEALSLPSPGPSKALLQNYKPVQLRSTRPSLFTTRKTGRFRLR